MNFFWIVNGRKMKQTLLIVVSAMIAAAIAFMNSEDLPTLSPPSGPHAISKVKTKQKQVALTFDLGWGEVQVKPILNTLKEEQVQATFFVSGSWAEHHPEWMKKIAENNNEIGAHGFGHKDYKTMEQKSMRSDMMLAREAIRKTSGESPTLLRPPDSSYNENTLNMATKLKYTIIDSSIHSWDITNPGVATIVQNVVKPVSPGDIILMHASDSAKQTAEALPLIIEKLRDKGYSFVTVSKLISNAETKTNLVN
ncbi:MAG TPA: polysaccharide deacetylase family sporulation protein PdaB [Bacillales bacterium]|nr:polysaccharide deacetylase family sporulation protein PdaB [Bacillales bacterium]